MANKPRQAKAVALRPRPPASLLGWEIGFLPSPELLAWVRQQIIAETGILHNEDHEHLADAKIGFLWTNQECNKGMRRIVGQAEITMYQGTTWQKARMIYQLANWFGHIPDFVITIDANYANECTDTEFCALVEHELYHCAQKLNAFGMPKFHRDGSPDYGIRGHDVEEFVGVVRRYGATSESVASMAMAAMSKPEIDSADISKICGTCMLSKTA